MSENLYKVNKIIRPLIVNKKLMFGGIVDWYLFCLFIMPSYFGIDLKLFDLTATRLFLILALYGIFISDERRNKFLELFKVRSIYLPMYAFFGVCLLTNILRVSLNGIFNTAVDTILAFFVIYYVIRYEIGLENLLLKIKVYAWILGICGVVEAVFHKSPFSYLRTLNYGAETAERFGSVRICGPCTTSNGYGLYLLILIPMICIAYRKNKIDLLKNKWLLLLLCLNVFLTGTRLALGMLGLELLLLFLFSNPEKKFLTFVFWGSLIGGLIIFLILFKDTEIAQSILRSIFTVVDTVFETTYSAEYGAVLNDLQNSDTYRELLPQVFSLEYLSPILGRGIGYNLSVVIEGYWIRSIDNYYIGIYVTYAYPGVVTFVLMQFTFLAVAIRNVIYMRKNAVSKVISIVLICYSICLWYLDQLQTYKYIYILFAMLLVELKIMNKERNRGKIKV